MKVCMVVPNAMVKGGIASVVNGYRGSRLEKECNIYYVESYCDGSKLKKLIKGIIGYFHFVWVLMIRKPDLVHIHSSFGPSFYRKIPFILLSNWFHKPVINHIHGADFDTFYRNASEKKQTLIRSVYERCDYFIALSDEWKANLSEIIPEDRVTVIENYSQLNVEAFRKRMKRDSNNRVLFLGEIGKRKGCYDIPEVIKLVSRSVPDVKFVLAGDGSSADKKAIHELLCTCGVVENVIFPGWIRGAEKDKQLIEADVFFLPSYNEGMPMSILDAMGYGLPVVSTNVGGIPKIVIDEENGYCCNPADTIKMAEGISRLLLDNHLRMSYAERSFQIVEKKFSLERHCNEIIFLYKKIKSAIQFGE